MTSSSAPTLITEPAGTSPELQAYPPPSSPMLESQDRPRRRVGILRRLGWTGLLVEEVLDDPAEKALNRLSERQLRRDYKRFKNRKVSSLVSLILCWSYPPLDSDKEMDADFDSFTSYVQVVDRILSKSPRGGLRLLVLSKTLPSHLDRELFTPSDELIATVFGGLRSLPLAPVDVLACLVSQKMGIPKALLDRPSTLLLQDLVPKPLGLPSHKASKGNLDPLRRKNHILLTWQSNPPIFETDFVVYVWEQHKSLPESNYADMRLYSSSDEPSSSEKMKLVLQFRKSRSIKLFSRYRAPSKVYRPSVRAEHQTLSPVSEVIFSICAGFQVMIQESSDFVNLSSSRISNMNLRARQDPSADKIWYLLHFEDCCTSSHNGIAHGLEVLDSLELWIEAQQQPNLLWDAGEPFESRLLTIRQDLEYLQKEVNGIKFRIKELQATIREHLELNHNRRSWIITIVGAIYLPLTMTTSFFGMNMDSSMKSRAESFSAWMNSTIAHTSADTGNQTQALVSAIATLGTQSYSWGSFFFTAGCLLMSLPLAFCIGPITRLAARYAAYGPIFTISPSTTPARLETSRHCFWAFRTGLG